MALHGEPVPAAALASLKAQGLRSVENITERHVTSVQTRMLVTAYHTH